MNVERKLRDSLEGELRELHDSIQVPKVESLAQRAGRRKTTRSLVSLGAVACVAALGGLLSFPFFRDAPSQDVATASEQDSDGKVTRDGAASTMPPDEPSVASVSDRIGNPSDKESERTPAGGRVLAEIAAHGDSVILASYQRRPDVANGMVDVFVDRISPESGKSVAVASWEGLDGVPRDLAVLDSTVVLSTQGGDFLLVDMETGVLVETDAPPKRVPPIGGQPLIALGSKIFDSERLAMVEVPSGKWRPTPDPPIAPSEFTGLVGIGTLGTEVVFANFTDPGLAFDVEAFTWRILPTQPIRVQATGNVSASRGHDPMVLVDSAGNARSLRSGSDEWVEIESPDSVLPDFSGPCGIDSPAGSDVPTFTSCEVVYAFSGSDGWVRRAGLPGRIVDSAFVNSDFLAISCGENLLCEGRLYRNEVRLPAPGN